MTKNYTTKSGSVYRVRVVGGVTEVMRAALGPRHASTAQKAKRLGDRLGLGVWHPCASVATGGAGDILRIYFGPDDALYTNLVVSVETEE